MASILAELLLRFSEARGLLGLHKKAEALTGKSFTPYVLLAPASLHYTHHLFRTHSTHSTITTMPADPSRVILSSVPLGFYILDCRTTAYA